MGNAERTMKFGGLEAQGFAAGNGHHLRPDDVPNVEHVSIQRWNTRAIHPQDISTVKEWFKDQDVPNHIFNDEINPYIPKHWYNKALVDRFTRGLEKFYFPGGPIKIETKIPREEGKPEPRNKQLITERKTHVALLNQRVVGVQSWLTDDPYAPEEDRRKIDEGELKVAYGHVMIVDPKYRDKGIALYMSARRADYLLGESNDQPGEYDQISTLIDLNGNNWGKVIEFFTRFGYSIDRRSLEEIPQLGQDGEQVRMYRYLMTSNDWYRARNRVVRAIEERMGIDYDHKKRSV